MAEQGNHTFQAHLVVVELEVSGCWNLLGLLLESIKITSI